MQNRVVLGVHLASRLRRDERDTQGRGRSGAFYTRSVAEPVVAALEELWSAMRRLLTQVRPEEWTLPTPCSDWNLQQLTAHVAGGQSVFEGLPQPEPPPDWSTEKQGTAALTARGVAARDDWTAQQVVEELIAGTDAQLARFRALDDAGWAGPAEWPPGDPTVRGYARNRLLDAYVHLLDMRVALGRPLDLDAEPTVFDQCLQQAYDFSGWGAVKQAGIIHDCRIRLDLAGPGGVVADLVIESRRGRLEPPTGEPTDRVTGTSAAFLFATVDRRAWWEQVGTLTVDGPAANRLADGYVIWL